MPVVAELYGQPLEESGMDVDACRKARCPFTESVCDGGGNRDMVRVRSSDESLGHLFSSSVGTETAAGCPAAFARFASHGARSGPSALTAYSRSDRRESRPNITN